MERVLKWISWLVVPIAVPGWLLEYVYRRLGKRFWEFGVWSGSVYIITIVGIALYLQLSSSIFLRVVSVYVLTALELLGLVSCIAVLVGDVGGYLVTVLKLARRKRSYVAGETLGKGQMWIAVSSFLYTALYFGVIDYFLFGLDDTLFVGISGSANGEILFDFIYSSYVLMTTFGYTTIAPARILSKSIYMLEITLALSYVLLILSLIAEQLISRRTEDSSARH